MFFCNKFTQNFTNVQLLWSSTPEENSLSLSHSVSTCEVSEDKDHNSPDRGRVVFTWFLTCSIMLTGEFTTTEQQLDWVWSWHSLLCCHELRLTGRCETHHVQWRCWLDRLMSICCENPSIRRWDDDVVTNRTCLQFNCLQLGSEFIFTGINIFC